MDKCKAVKIQQVEAYDLLNPLAISYGFFLDTGGHPKRRRYQLHFTFSDRGPNSKRKEAEAFVQEASNLFSGREVSFELRKVPGPSGGMVYIKLSGHPEGINY